MLIVDFEKMIMSRYPLGNCFGVAV